MSGVDGRYLFECLWRLGDVFNNVGVFENVQNRIKGGLIVSGVFESSIAYNKKNDYSISKRPSDKLKLATMKDIVVKFNNYTNKFIVDKDTKYDFLLEDITNLSYIISDNKNLCKYVAPKQIDNSQNIFLYVKSSLFEHNKLKENMYVDWFLDEITLAGNLDMVDDLERFLEFHHSDLLKKKNSKSSREKLLTKEYDYLSFQIGQVKKQFDLRYILSK